MKKLMIVLAVLLVSFSARAQRPTWDGGGIYFGTTDVLGDFYDMNVGRSTNFAIDVFGVKVPFVETGALEFRANVRYTYDNLFFTENMTLTNVNGVPVKTPLLGNDIKKSKLRFHTVSLPVGFAVNAGKVSFGALFAPGYTLGVSTKYKNPKTKGSVSGYEKISYRVEGIISYDGYGVYVNYGLNPLFSEGIYGDDAHFISFGAVLGF